jgi:hypothetical protein
MQLVHEKCLFITKTQQKTVTYPTGESLNGRVAHFCQDYTITPLL